jgi:hypothetical protein
MWQAAREAGVIATHGKTLAQKRAKVARSSWSATLVGVVSVDGLCMTIPI